MQWLWTLSRLAFVSVWNRPSWRNCLLVALLMFGGGLFVALVGLVLLSAFS